MTVKELITFLEACPEDQVVLGYRGGNGDLHAISAWVDDETGEIVIDVD
jgi:hypothetical protein